LQDGFFGSHIGLVLVAFATPGQTLAPVFVTALTKITILFDFLVPPLRPRFGTLKTSKRAEAGAHRMEVFQKAE
jgi:hypothetical protein